MKKKYIANLFTFALVISLILGCGQNVSAESSGDTKDDVVLEVWLAKSFSEAANEAMQERFESFAEASDKVSEVRVEFLAAADVVTKLNTAIGAGVYPDVAIISDDVTQSYVQMGALEPLDDLIEEVTANNGDLIQGAKDNIYFDGHYYAVPYSFSVNTVHYRKDVFEEAGITELPTTWQEFEKVCEILADKTDMYPAGLAISNSDDSETCNRWIHKSFGGRYWDEEGNVVVNSQETIDAVNWLVDMYNKGYIPPSSVEWDSAGNNNTYLAGESAMVVNISTLYVTVQGDDMKDTLGKNTGLMALPVGENYSPWSEPSTGKFGIFKGCKNPELSKELISYVMDPEWYSSYIEQLFPVNSPTYQGTIEDDIWQSELGQQLTAITLSEAYNHQFGYPCTDPVVQMADSESEINYYFSKTVLRVLLEGMSVEDSVEQLESELIELKEDVASRVS